MTFLQLAPFCLLFSLAVIGLGYWMVYEMIYDKGYLAGMTEEHKQRAAAVLAARKAGFDAGRQWPKKLSNAPTEEEQPMDQHDVANAILNAKISHLKERAETMLDGLQEIPRP